MNPKNRPTSSSSNPKVYPLVETQDGYQFTTSNGSVYEVYFGDGREYFTGAPFSHLALWFGFSQKQQPPKGANLIDGRIKATIKSILYQALEADPSLIIVFNCSSEGGKQASRSKLFDRWFDGARPFYELQDYVLRPGKGSEVLIKVILSADHEAVAAIPDAIKVFEANKLNG